MKKLWEKIKAWLVAIWAKIKKWAKETALPWLKVAWIQIVNVLIVLFAYGKLDDILNGQEVNVAFATALVGFWAFILAGYWIFWKLLGADKVVKAFIKQQREKRKK